MRLDHWRDLDRPRRDEVVRAAPGEGRTVVMVSHELDVARALATREVRVDGGRVVTDSRPPVPSAGTEPDAAAGGTP